MQHISFGHQKVLPIRGDFCFGTGYLNGRQRTNLYLFLVVLKQAVGRIEGLLCYADAFVEGDQIPINVQYSGNGCDELLFKLKLRDLDAVLRDGIFLLFTAIPKPCSRF